MLNFFPKSHRNTKNANRIDNKHLPIHCMSVHVMLLASLAVLAISVK